MKMLDTVWLYQGFQWCCLAL